MGNTTIIELNHDCWNEIDNDRKLFVQQILEQLQANEYEGKEILGGRVICFFNRYDSPIERAWLKFKKKFGR